MFVTSSLLFVFVRLSLALPTLSSNGLDFDAALSTDAAADSTFEEGRRLSMMSTTRRSASTNNVLSPFARPDFDDFDGRLNDSFFKYVIRTDNYDKNEVPWAEGGKPVRVQMSAYLRKVSILFKTIFYADFSNSTFNGLCYNYRCYESKKVLAFYLCCTVSCRF
jgi:hypothetical protein